MDGTLSPFVYWGQSKSNIFLRVDLRNVKNPEIDVTENTLSFKARGQGARGLNTYQFLLEFLNPINPRASHYQVSEFHVEFDLTKTDPELWTRLLLGTLKPEWLKVDFDKLYDADGSFEEETTAIQPVPPYPDFQRRTNWSRPRKQKKTEDYRKIYLFLYNLLQFVGFLYIMIVMSIRYLKMGPDSMTDTYKIVGTPFRFCQMLQILEIVHPLLSFTRGSAVLPFVQVFGRMVTIFIMIDAEPRMQPKPVVFYLFYVYTLSEIVRYPYYMLKTYNVEIGFLTWLRYTLWIALYPMGFLCEGIIFLRNIRYLEDSGRFSMSMPNQLNFSFYFPGVIRLYLLLGFFPGLYFMMSYMYRQRKLILSRPPRRNRNIKAD